MAGPGVPDIATLRAICHRGKVSKDSRPWYVLQRRVAIYLTWLLLHTPLQANQVTLLSVALALAGGALLAMPGPGFAVAGALSLVLHHLFDKVDGDVARFRQTHSIVGVYLDELGHAVAFAGVFLGLGLHLAWHTPAAGPLMGVLLTAAVGALSMVLGRYHKSVGFLLYAQYALTNPELLPHGRVGERWGAFARESVHRSRRDGAATRERPKWIVWLRDLALQLSDFSLMIALVLVGAIVEGIRGDQLFLRVVLFAEAALQSAVFAALVVVNAAVNVESEVSRLEALVRSRDESTPKD
jgi:phosphatidylglycerophosphate synthase